MSTERPLGAEEEEFQSNQAYRDKWMFPAGSVSPSSTNINKPEAWMFSILQTMADINELLEQHQAEDFETIRRGEIPKQVEGRGALAMHAFFQKRFIKNYSDFKNSVDRCGRKDNLQISVSTKSGVTHVPKKLSRWDRLRGRKSEEYIPQDGGGQQ